MEPSPEDIHRILKSKSCRADCIFPVKTILFPLQLWKLFPHSRCGCSGPFWVESFTIDLYKLLLFATPEVLCHKEPARASYKLGALLLAGSLWHKGAYIMDAWKPPIPYAIKNQRGASKIPWSWFFMA